MTPTSGASGAGDAASTGPGGAARKPRRVVISSVTGKPIPWDDEETDASAGPQDPRPILPDRVAEDVPEPGTDESNDSRLAGDVPPHWGRGR